MKLLLHRYDLPLRHVFTISRGSSRTSPTLIVELEQDGKSGYGEAGESDFYGAGLDQMTAALERVRPQLEAARLEKGDKSNLCEAPSGPCRQIGLIPFFPAELWQQLSPILSADSFAQCALDLAAHDLWGKLRGQPVWKLWGLRLENLPATDYTIGIDSIDVMVRKMEEFSGWPIYKIKLGTPDDLGVVRELRRHTDAVFRVDANCAWGVEETLRNAAALKDLGVEFIEQPLPPDRWDDMKRVFAESPLPIIADESCQREPDVDRCTGHFHGINVKLVKCGGLTPARRMISRARELGLKTMVGCMTESTVGISAIAQLVPMLDYVDMDGALLLAEDIASGVRLECGRVIYPDEPGCGVRLM